MFYANIYKTNNQCKTNANFETVKPIFWYPTKPHTQNHTHPVSQHHPHQEHQEPHNINSTQNINPTPLLQLPLSFQNNNNNRKPASATHLLGLCHHQHCIVEYVEGMILNLAGDYPFIWTRQVVESYLRIASLKWRDQELMRMLCCPTLQHQNQEKWNHQSSSSLRPKNKKK